jgi:hypothetical protein
MTDHKEEPMTTTAVEPYAPGEITPRRWEQMEREARVFAKSGKVPKEYAGQPDAIMAVLITAEELGMKAGLNALKAFHFIEGSAVPSAQLMVALARAGGHDIRTTFVDETRCVVEGRRRGSEHVEEFSYSIEQAKRAGQLDPWVERWQDSANGKRYLEKYFLKVRGGANRAAMPEWAKKLVDAGHTKIKEAWFRYPEDLLKASAIRRACRAICPDVLLGLPSVDAQDLGAGGPSPAASPTRAVQHDAHDAEDIVEGELIDDEVPDQGLDGEPIGGASDDTPQEPPPDELVTQGFRARFAIAAKNLGLTEDQRHELISVATSGRTRTSKELRKSDVASLFRWFRGVQQGEYEFSVLSDGNEALVPRSEQQEIPLEETA